jgi:hypothetical protein
MKIFRRKAVTWGINIFILFFPEISNLLEIFDDEVFLIENGYCVITS